jgi:hypothetical protein
MDPDPDPGGPKTYESATLLYLLDDGRVQIREAQKLTRNTAFESVKF